MSRSAGSFADFFPAAPSVIQQRQKKAALDRQHGKSRTSEPTRVEDTRTDGPALPDHPASTHTNAHNAAEFTNGTSDHEGKYHLTGEAGDMLNGVGSASSLNSVVSSVFSNPTHAENGHHNGVGLGSLALTPLTNHESSPPEKISSPRKNGINHAQPQALGARPGSLAQQNVTAGPQWIKTESDLPLQSTRIQTRPGHGHAKGVKAVYDPELDTKISSKEKRKLKPRYKKFGEEVCWKWCAVQIT